MELSECKLNIFKGELSKLHEIFKFFLLSPNTLIWLSLSSLAYVGVTVSSERIMIGNAYMIKLAQKIKETGNFKAMDKSVNEQTNVRMLCTLKVSKRDVPHVKFIMNPGVLA